MKFFLKKIIKFISRPKENYPNIYILGYHLLKALQKSLIKLRLIKQTQTNARDMFNWSLYDLHYKGELKEAEKEFTINLKPNDYIYTNSKLIKNNKNIKPLHPSHRLLYETILQLNPSSVFEMGCGSGMHLYNLQTLNSQIKLSGIDLSEKQINSLHKRYPKLEADIKQADATANDNLNNLPQVDLAFTQAVIMHIHTDHLHMNALENLFKMSKKYVLLYESPKNHKFMDDINYLFNQKRILWNNLFFYYRINEENNKPSPMICSNEKLNYLVLEDYNILFN